MNTKSYPKFPRNQPLKEKLLAENCNFKPSVIKEQILVVDDTYENLKLVSDFLRDAGFKILIAKSGIQALKLLENAVPDLILLDVMMPEMNGFETCQYLKGWEKTRDIPVIFMTAATDASDPTCKVQGLTLGAVDYITKPIQLEEVLARVKTHLHLRSLTRQLQQEICERKQAEAAIVQSERNYRELVETSQDIIWSVDEQGNFTFINSAVKRIFGYEPEEMLGRPFSDFAPPEQVTVDQSGLKYVLSGESVFGYETKYLAKDGRPIYLLRNTIPKRDAGGRVIGATGTATDITARKQAARLLAGQNHILAAIASDVPLEDILKAIAELVESQSEQMRCSFFLLDADNRLRLGAAPSLPEGYNQAVDGVVIGPNVGSCGAAVYRKATVIVEDIASDPLWTDYKDLALSYGLRACWSTPILATDGTVLGTFAGYYAQPRKAADIDRDLIAQTLYLAKIAIERQRSQACLRQSKERLQLALEGSDLGLWDWNMATGEIYFDPQWKRMLGYEVEEIENNYQSWVALLHPDDVPKTTDALNAYLEGRIPVYELEIRMLCKSGEWKWILGRGKIFEWDEIGKPLRMAGTHRDITERKKAEQELKQSEAREREKAEKLKFTLSALKRTQAQLIQSEKMSSLGRMVAGIAHEINNPVSFIYGNLTPAREYFQNLKQLVELYQNTYPNSASNIQQFIDSIDLEFIVEDWEKLMKSMQFGAERIEQIVLSLQNFSRLNESAIKPIDIHESLDNTLIILQNRLISHDDSRAGQERIIHAEINVIKHYGELPKIACYASQLNQVFMHILANAIDALENQPEPRIITISTSRITRESPRPNSEFAVIRIADNGAGMSEDVRLKIFDPFFTTKPVGSGTGLGLSISYQIVVEKHKGRIRCNSAPGQGTELIVEIPVNSSL
ncbi:MAG TPA: PAS domain S-box protein [Coleofasciculaceae cyanobacterium]